MSGSMGGVKRNYFVVLAVFMLSVGLGGRRSEAQVHHVVGGVRGWDPSSDIGSWLSGRIFRVGDNIWFLTWTAQENITEVRSMEEFLSCDLSNPIRMYTDGVNRITLDGEGVRYFASSNPDSCKDGLKLNVEVKPQPPKIEALAAGPTPSGSIALRAGSALLGFGLAFIYFIGF